MNHEMVEQLTIQALSDLYEEKGKPQYVESIERRVRLRAGVRIPNGSVQLALDTLAEKGWIVQFRAYNGLMRYRTKREDELRAVTKDILILQNQLNDAAITKYQIFLMQDDARIGDRYPVRMEDEHVKNLRIIQKTKNLCVFEGNIARQWQDLVRYVNGIADAVG